MRARGTAAGRAAAPPGAAGRGRVPSAAATATAAAAASAHPHQAIIAATANAAGIAAIRAGPVRMRVADTVQPRYTQANMAVGRATIPAVLTMCRA